MKRINGARVDRKYVQGIGKIQGRLLIVIDPSFLFNDRECAAFAAASA
jgi:chemotaxis signal transduction protein